MSASDDLTGFVKEALTRGVSRADIKATLLEAGWSPRQVADALGTWADVAFPVPVPRPRHSTDAREAFLYGLMIVALGLAAFNLGAFLFSVIEQLFPLGNEQNFGEATRWPISLLIVAVPVLVYVTRLIARDVALDPGKLASKNRSQTTYGALFVCAAIVIGVLAGVVYNFLGGDLTSRFLLKSVTAAGIAAAIFAYYLRDMRAAAGDPA